MTYSNKRTPAVLTLAVMLAACVGGEDEGKDESDDAAMDGSEDMGDGDGSPDLPPEDVSWAEVSAIFQDRECAGCHGTISDTYESVVANWLEGPSGNVLEGKMEISHRIDGADAQVVLAWIEDGYPED